MHNQRILRLCILNYALSIEYLLPEGLGADVDLEVLDGAGDIALHAGEGLDAGNFLLRAEVDDEVVGEGHSLHGAPIGRLLKVEDLVARAIVLLGVLAVGIVDRPRLAR